MHLKVRKNRNKEKKTVFYQILRVNLCLSLAFILLFCVNSFRLNQQAKNQTELRIGDVRDNLINEFKNETQRMNTFLNMCDSHSAFIMAISNRLPNSIRANYRRMASESLALLEYALPYAEQVYAYIENTNQILLSRNAVVSQTYFDMEILHLAEEESHPDFRSFDDGFYQLGGKNYYVHNFRNYGNLILQVDAERFCGLQTLETMWMECYGIVLNHGNIFTSSSSYANLLYDEFQKGSNTKSRVRLDGTSFRVVSGDMSKDISLLLFVRDSDIQMLVRQNTLFNILGGFILLFCCLLLIRMNAAIYQPLKKIAKSLDVEQGDNEFEAIHRHIYEITKVNQQIQIQLKDRETNQLDMELKYALISGQQISQSILHQLAGQYSDYRIIRLALQNQTGKEDGEFFLAADSYLMDSLDAKCYTLNPYLHFYIISGMEPVRIKKALELCCEKVKPGYLAFVGLSDVFSDLHQLGIAFDQSRKRLEYNTVSLQKRFSIQDGESAGSKSRVLSIEQLNTISKQTLNGTPETIEETLEQFFFGKNNLLLKEYLCYYSQLRDVFRNLLQQANTVSNQEEFLLLRDVVIYHPVLMFDRLRNDYKKLNSMVSSTSASLRYEIIDYIHKHFDEPLSLESISAQFHITPVYLSSWFKKNIGINLSVYLSGYRMEKAGELLKNHPELKIMEISEKIGITSASTFIRQFKNHYGCTPEQYRNSNI